MSDAKRPDITIFANSVWGLIGHFEAIIDTDLDTGRASRACLLLVGRFFLEPQGGRDRTAQGNALGTSRG